MKPRVVTPGGFTLIEVLISLAIFALAAIMMAVTYLNVISSYQAVARRQQNEEVWKLVRSVVLTETDRTKIEAGGRLPLSDRSNIGWKATIEPTEIADLFAVTVHADPEISTDEPMRVNEKKILLLRPSWSDAAERDKLRADSQRRLADQRAR